MRRSTAVRFLAALLPLACASAPSAAIDLAASVQELSSANVATVVLVPPMAIFQRSLDATGLANAGCHYTTADPEAIRALVAMVRSAELVANPVYQRPDMREGIYFAMEDGAKFSVLFADNAGGRLPVLGVAENSTGGQIRSASVSAKSSLPTDLRGWAGRYGGAGVGSACDLQSGRAQDPQAPAPLPR